MTHPRLIVVRGSDRQLYDTDFDPDLADDQFFFEPDSGSGVDAESLQISGSQLAAAPTHPDQVGLTAVGITRANLQESPQYSFTSADNGRTITERKFSSQINIDGVDGLTFERCWIGASSSGGSYAILKKAGAAGTNMLFEDCDFGAHGSGAYKDTGVGFLQTATYRRCLFYNFGDCIKLGHLRTARIEDCWIQPIFVDPKHTDCMQYNNGDWGEFYALRTTYECREWKKNGVTCHSQEELDGGATRGDAGNACLHSNPCNVSGTVPCEPKTGAFYSWVDCIITGANYIATCANQNGEFKRNIVIRGSANSNNDLGLRDRTNIAIPDTGSADRNVFHDDGAFYGGGKVNPNQESDPGPIPFLGL